jgi:ribosome maturation factor RimP
VRERLTALLAPVVAGLGLELWGLEFGREGGRQVLRVLVDSPAGVTGDDCQRASAAISDALDATDPIPDAYVLEVASPGVDRVLRHAGDYARFVGSHVQLTLTEPVVGRSRIEGTLEGLRDEHVLVRTDRGQVSVPLQRIGQGRLALAGFGTPAPEGRRDGQPGTAAQ